MPFAVLKGGPFEEDRYQNLVSTITRSRCGVPKHIAAFAAPHETMWLGVAG